MVAMLSEQLETLDDVQSIPTYEATTSRAKVLLPESAAYTLNGVQLFPTFEGTTSVSTMLLPESAADTRRDYRIFCEVCGGRFRRPQELKRHVGDVHAPQRQCPFCNFQWKRPNKIKAHILDAHRDIPDILRDISKLRGKALVEFVAGLGRSEARAQA